MQLAALFERALDLLFPPGDTARIVRSCSSESILALIDPRMTESGAVALLPYRHRLVRALIVEAKFRRNPRAVALLHEVLAEYLAAAHEEEARFGALQRIVVPVPLGAARRKERGYNQTEEIAAGTGSSDTSLLIRVRDTRPQTSLTRTERLRNMESAFAVAGSIAPNVSYILLDDVITTGATLGAAADALKKAGASDVRMLALAH